MSTIKQLEARVVELEAQNAALAAQLEKCMGDMEAAILNATNHIPASAPHVPGLVDVEQLKSLKGKVFKHIKDVGAALKDVGKLSTSVRIERVPGGFSLHL